MITIRHITRPHTRRRTTTRIVPMARINRYMTQRQATSITTPKSMLPHRIRTPKLTSQRSRIRTNLILQPTRRLRTNTHISHIGPNGISTRHSQPRITLPTHLSTISLNTISISHARTLTLRNSRITSLNIMNNGQSLIITRHRHNTSLSTPQTLKLRTQVTNRTTTRSQQMRLIRIQHTRALTPQNMSTTNTRNRTHHHLHNINTTRLTQIITTRHRLMIRQHKISLRTHRRHIITTQLTMHITNTNNITITTTLIRTIMTRRHTSQLTRHRTISPIRLNTPNIRTLHRSQHIRPLPTRTRHRLIQPTISRQTNGHPYSHFTTHVNLTAIRLSINTHHVNNRSRRLTTGHVTTTRNRITILMTINVKIRTRITQAHHTMPARQLTTNTSQRTTNPINVTPHNVRTSPIPTANTRTNQQPIHTTHNSQSRTTSHVQTPMHHTQATRSLSTLSLISQRILPHRNTNINTNRTRTISRRRRLIQINTARRRQNTQSKTANTNRIRTQRTTRRLRRIKNLTNNSIVTHSRTSTNRNIISTRLRTQNNSLSQQRPQLTLNNGNKQKQGNSHNRRHNHRKVALRN